MYFTTIRHATALLCMLTYFSCYGMDKEKKEDPIIGINHALLCALLNNDTEEFEEALPRADLKRALIHLEEGIFSPLALALYKINFIFATAIAEQMISLNDVERDGQTPLTASTLYADDQLATIYNTRFDGAFSGGAEKCETKESLSFFSYLLEKNITINKQNSEGKTALHIAVSRRLNERVEILLQHGADIYLPDGSGITPCKLAYTVDIGHPHIAKISPYAAAKQLVQRKHRENNKEKIRKIQKFTWKAWIDVSNELT